LCLLPLTAAAQLASNPYAHYDAAVASSITLGAPVNFVPAPYTQAVVQWDDQTSNNFDGTNILDPTGHGGERDPVYPGPLGHTFPNGVTGIDFADTPDPMGMGGNGKFFTLLPAGAAQNGLLDFSAGGAANAKSGFSMYIVYHVDSHRTSQFGNYDYNYLLGNATFPNHDGPGLWFNKNESDDNAILWAHLEVDDTDGFTGNSLSLGTVSPGQDIIISFNYNKTTGNWTVAHLNNGPGSSSGSDNTPANNFTSIVGSGPRALGIGGSPDWANLRADGDFGEVILYDRFIDPTSAEHTNTIAFLQNKWFVAPGLDGDFNDDGKVDAADYVVWRKNETANAALPNDDGLTTQAERFNLWRSNFGDMAGSGGGVGSSSVPEPSTGLLLVMTLLALVPRRGHKFSR
jgi:hypothetical protein